MPPTTAPATAAATSPATTAPADETPARPARRTPAPSRPASMRHATDDEILGISHVHQPSRVIPRTEGTRDLSSAAANDDDSLLSGAESANYEPGSAPGTPSSAPDEPENFRDMFDANPELRRAWQDAHAYRETFATPEEARAATALLSDLDRMDALFFSRRPEDHAELARAVADLDPAAFASLAQAMNGLATESQRRGENPAGNNAQNSGAQAASADARATAPASSTPSMPTPVQAEFFHTTNAAAVESVIEAIESQVERLLPEGISKSARSRVVGEIYRELDSTLRANRQLGQQMREAFRSGSLDAEHQRAIVSLVTGRARQALPGVAKRVLNEWTSTIVAANQDRRARQRSAERRVDIAGSSGAGNDGRRSMTPREIDYSRMSDADILNM